MSRAALAVQLVLSLAATGIWPSVANAIDPHLDPTLVPGSCAACHEGHGMSRSPMLPAPQTEVCLSCHESRAGADRLAGSGTLSFSAAPALLGGVLSQPFTHPMSSEAFSRREPGAVTCTSCHSAHRSMPPASAGTTPTAGVRKLSPRSRSQFEYQLCQSCHGSQGISTQSRFDLSRLFSPSSRSYHPVEAPALERSSSVNPDQAGREINCTDCHGNSDPAGPVGPHGSSVAYILVDDYATVDGSAETERSYALCYRCHARERVLDSSTFPLHRLHIADVRASCATCHSSHGSIENRALIRFGEETFIGGVGPSMLTGRLAFDSTSSGEGSCHLTCHGVDHAPETYGSGIIRELILKTGR